ncbi:MAG: glycosyltransferase family 2 protein [Armatimonadetes bacterium]|nr:glycosyltransferase family 2 protein [Armatimonadota bacterium]
MKLSICIVTWNCRDLLRACLESIPRRDDFETIVVDNASNDGTAQMVEQEFPWVRLIANDQNQLYAKGNNQAFETAMGEFVLMLNPDTELEPDALDNALAVLDEHPDVGAVGGLQRFPDGTIQPSVRGFPTPSALFYETIGLARIFPRSKKLNVYRMRWFKYDQEIEVDQPMATFLMTRRIVIEQVGGMDERFPLFFNDVDWCYRVRQAGWKILFSPNVRLVHHGGASTSQARKWAIRESHRSLEEFYRKHYQTRLWPSLYWTIVGLIRITGFLRPLKAKN